MIVGSVNDQREAVVSLRLIGASGSELETQFVIDTGFSGMLTLPLDVIKSLGLVAVSEGVAVLADGVSNKVVYYTVDIDLGGESHSGMDIGEECYLGMQLLEGHELKIAVRPGGDVEITPLP
jgi:clan AA aspartic protease